MASLAVFLLSNVWEELGWRGFALSVLTQRWSDLAASVWLGLVAFAWHLPLFFVVDSPMSRLPWILQLVFLIANGVLMTWVYRGTGESVLWVTVFHAMANAVALGMLEVGLYVRSYPIVVGLVAASAGLVALRYGRRRFASRREWSGAEGE
uniref:CPBP family intramembrane metalloprotease n=1 Tax=Thermomicrobium roseum TaxID=500 RepID=A0A7C5RSG9_THERO